MPTPNPLSLRKIVKYVLIILTILILIYCLSYAIRLGRYKQAAANLVINEADLSSIEDGTYIGSCDIDFVAATVEVTVSNHMITNINLVNHHTDKGKAAEAIIPKIVDAQSLQIDAVSGATNSSKVIKKAIENALTTN